MKANNNAPLQLESISPALELLYSVALGSYPYDFSSSWIPFSKMLDDFHLDEKISKHYLRTAGILNNDDTWNEELLEYGLITEAAFEEVEQHSGYCSSIILTLVSDRGINFFRLCFDLLCPGKR